MMEINKKLFSKTSEVIPQPHPSCKNLDLGTTSNDAFEDLGERRRAKGTKRSAK